ncbi:hypothetical protein DBR40_04760 [Pedobacter sp. KBW01]|nr:hypothetical protein DBR40_04760 [Pedobacter sp. KBW01]
MKSNAHKNKLDKSVKNTINMPRPSLKPKTKKKKKTIRPGLYSMIFFWILAVLLGAAIIMKMIHFFNTHW